MAIHTRARRVGSDSGDGCRGTPRLVWSEQKSRDQAACGIQATRLVCRGAGAASTDLWRLGCFTEGFDTADIQDAKALLEELGG